MATMVPRPSHWPLDTWVDVMLAELVALAYLRAHGQATGGDLDAMRRHIVAEVAEYTKQQS